MSLIKTVENLAKGAVGTAASAARHPIGTTAHVVGFAKGVAVSGIALVRPGEVPAQRRPEPPAAAEPTPAPEPAPEPARTPVAEPELPGPDIVLAGVPDPDDLPEPIVIEADDEPGPETGEAFWTEPKATTRPDSIGGRAGDLFEAEDEADEALEELTDPPS